MQRLLILFSLCLVGARCSEYGVDRIDEDPAGAGDRLLQVQPDSIDFGDVAAGTVVTDSFTISSIGTGAVTLEPLHVQGSGSFTIVGDPLPDSLAPGDTVRVEVAYEPASGEDEAQVIVESDAQVPQIPVELLGAGVMPDLVFDPQVLELRSYDGNPVYASFVARNEGAVDLEVYEWVLQGERFEVETELPGTLGPGEESEIHVTWTPAVEGEDIGYFWASSNDPDGNESATLEGFYQLPCLGLHEAFTRGWADIYSDSDGIHVEHIGEDLDICIDRWYVYISDETQDAGAGDPAYVDGDVYGEEGSIVLERGDSVVFDYGSPASPAWWCVEETQITDTAHIFHFTGARVPTVLLDTMLGGEAGLNDVVWSDIRNNPMMVVGRERGWTTTVAGGTSLVQLEVVNIGRVAGEAVVYETIPVGMEASDFDPVPSGEVVEDDGSVTYRWELSLDAAVDTAKDTQTIYDSAGISYLLELGQEACLPRARVPEPAVQWSSSSGVTLQAEGSPFIVECW